MFENYVHYSWKTPSIATFLLKEKTYYQESLTITPREIPGCKKTKKHPNHKKICCKFVLGLETLPIA